MGHAANVGWLRFRAAFCKTASANLKLLLETKHLYQKVSIEVQTLAEKEITRDMELGADTKNFLSLVNTALANPFALVDKPTIDAASPLCLIVGNVRIVCSVCKRREAFRPIWFSDITSELRTKQELLMSRIALRNDFQLFTLVYQCQRCEGTPEAFLVRRDGLDLIAEGRSPLEHVELPTFIPEDEKKWFRDAVIAFQSGKVLAALFYLRTFIEQFARRKTGTQHDKKTGDEILSAYAQTIPSNLRDRMPSLSEWYGKVSAAIHGADEDAGLFESAREKIEEHFDIRRVHKLDVVPESEAH